MPMDPTFPVYIEIEKGGLIKYEYDKTAGKLVAILIRSPTGSFLTRWALTGMSLTPLFFAQGMILEAIQHIGLILLVRW